jgi:hypothetical protein
MRNGIDLSLSLRVRIRGRPVRLPLRRLLVTRLDFPVKSKSGHEAAANLTARSLAPPTKLIKN